MTLNEVLILIDPVLYDGIFVKRKVYIPGHFHSSCYLGYVLIGNSIMLVCYLFDKYAKTVAGETDSHRLVKFCRTFVVFSSNCSSHVLYAVFIFQILINRGHFYGRLHISCLKGKDDDIKES